jgi:ribosomal protein S6E (S10)
VPPSRAIPLSHAPRLYARTRTPRRNAPIHFDKMEVELQGQDGGDDKAEDKDKESEYRPSLMVQPRQQQQQKLTFGSSGYKPREQAPGHRRRRSVRGF